MSNKISNFVLANNSSDLGRAQFVIDAALSGLRVAMPVKVMSVINNGGVSAIGTVSILPLVNAKDGGGNAVPHGTIYNVPYMRIQGGTNAVILDPQVGDIGLAVVCDRDISAVQNTQAQAPAGSSRKHDMSDFIYVMTVISAKVPTQYVQFNSSGITVTSPNTIIINANEVDINAATIKMNGSVITTGTLTNNGHSVGSNHVHSGVTPGGSNTGIPT